MAMLNNQMVIGYHYHFLYDYSTIVFFSITIYYNASDAIKVLLVLVLWMEKILH